MSFVPYCTCCEIFPTRRCFHLSVGHAAKPHQKLSYDLSLTGANVVWFNDATRKSERDRGGFSNA